MGINLSGIDLANVAESVPFEAIPAGWYNCIMTDMESKPTKDGNGSYLECTYSITDGAHKGRKLFDRLNVQNANATAVEIAFGTLKSIYSAVGKVRVSDSSELYNIPLKVKVGLRAARTDDNGKTYEASNEVKGYDGINSARGAAPVGGVAGSPAGTPAWAVGAAPAVAAPVAAPAPVVAAPAPAPAPISYRMTEKANGATREAFEAQGWSLEQLIEHGYMAPNAPAAPAAPAPAPAPAAWSPPVAAVAAPAVGGVAPWAR